MSVLLTRPGLAELDAAFAQIHRQIYRSERISQAAGFAELVKLVALKLASDEKARRADPDAAARGRLEAPAAGVEFSVGWIDSRPGPDPVNDILFQGFAADADKRIGDTPGRRFFDPGERIGLKPETIRNIVRQLEGWYLLGVEADLAGRLFERFLSSTMRGKALGQHFTPRSVVRLGVGLADLAPDDRVLDACCGTGGFLVAASAGMSAKAGNGDTAAGRIVGFDFAKNPNLARIARLNMYLACGGPGGPVFNLDALDPAGAGSVDDTPEEALERRQIADLGLEGSFDKALTNPPFAALYSRSNPAERRVMEQWPAAAGRETVTAKCLFFELYHRYLRAGGRLVTVIDDGFLSAPEHGWARDRVRSMYTVRAVVSLPGDAFQRSDARVKTSLLVLEKRGADAGGGEPDVFMHACRHVGVDDPKRVRWMPGDDERRDNATREADQVIRAFKAFLACGEVPAGSLSAPAADVGDRLDVKSRFAARSAQAAEGSPTLADSATPRQFGPEDVVVCADHDQPERLLTVRYDGTAAAGAEVVPSAGVSYARMFRVSEGDIVISNIAACLGGVAVVDENLAGSLVSKEYTVLQTAPGRDPRVVWAVLRSPRFQAEMLLRSSGANRTRVRWPDIAGIAFPYPDDQTAGRVARHLGEADKARRQAQTALRQAVETLQDALGLDTERALAVLDAFKAPS